MSTITFAVAPAVFLLAYIPAFAKNQIVGRMSRTNQLGKQDYFNNPRAAQDALLRDPEQAEKAALVSRIMGTHNNMLEGLSWFYASLIFAMVGGVPRRNIDGVALAYLVLRLVYCWLYITGTVAWKGIARTLVFLTCVTMCAYLFIHAATLVPKPQ